MRFVTTPEVLERSVTLEKEIEQIEDSIQANAAAIAGEAEGMFGQRIRDSKLVIYLIEISKSSIFSNIVVILFMYRKRVGWYMDFSKVYGFIKGEFFLSLS